MSDPVLELDYGDLGLEEEREEAPAVAFRLVRSTPPYPHPDTARVGEMLRRMRLEREEAAAAFDAGGQVTVLDWDEPGDQPKPAAQLVGRLLGSGWEVQTQVSVVRIAPTRYVGTTEEHTRGDIKAPSKDVTYYGVQARLVKPAGPVAAVWATWAQTVKPTGKTSTTFDNAVCWDVAQGQWASDRLKDLAEWLDIFAPVRSVSPGGNDGEARPGS